MLLLPPYCVSTTSWPRPGRPALYGTSASFLEVFGLPSLRDLPPLRELESLFEEEGTPAAVAAASAPAEQPVPGRDTSAPGEEPCEESHADSESAPSPPV